ncbi:MAG: bifunctional hydroxymethylpyrimidine kinase/phosphomethylpyrimidine kinase [Amaricoccus sp.]|uniref:bifunctional hydroxymethylpyrimidine kinase/phosphomethylpyrimidine kinase n=1 Tax=Amaricoccus sp. TaxID=1872485 RepID=UPI0039E34CE0
MAVAKALTIAGSDSGGGAGVQADLKTFSARGVYGASVLTAVTAQNTRAVTAVAEVAPAVVAAQLDAVLADIAIDAIKVGMLFSAAIVDEVAERLRGILAPVVLDPVMVAKSGDALLEPEATGALVARLVPGARLVTPNLPEAARLLGGREAATVAEMAAQGAALRALGAQAVLVKGGHGTGAACTDVLVTGTGDPVLIEAPRHPTQNTHGTGCSYSSAITAELAKGLDLIAAVRVAHAWLQGAIAAADRLEVGGGRGPVHHFHAVWPA